MQRDFEKGFNQLPQASVNVAGNIYPLKAQLVSGEEDSELYAVYEIDEKDDEKNLYKIKCPTENNIPYSRLVFGAAKIAAEDFLEVGFADKSFVRWVAFDDEDGEPELGDFVGTQADSYKMSLYKFGFECLGYDSTNELALVRPCPLMPTVVKATAAESDGEVTVKFCDYEGNVSGDAFTVYTLTSP